RPSFCNLPVKPGPCNGFFSAFYYSQKKNKCHSFTYGGCKGNANRFSTIEECRRTCVG
uniref:Mambaquaretin-3 n=1 Tax=Dendroaspis polylepis polylepis TaxID=8620 RepID=MAMB3_DENPO|nr:RecName: Full=Mambaquaretin-3; Short=MQ3; AltName: Full=Upsilon-Dp2a [Dendroaspis polylepis polylepis]